MGKKFAVKRPICRGNMIPLEPVAWSDLAPGSPQELARPGVKLKNGLYENLESRIILVNIFGNVDHILFVNFHTEVAKLECHPIGLPA